MEPLLTKSVRWYLANSLVLLLGSFAAATERQPAQTPSRFYYPTTTVSGRASRIPTPFLAGSRSSSVRYDFLTSTGEAAVHVGTDISAPLGDPVFALTDGEIQVELASRPISGFGWDVQKNDVVPGGALVIKHQFRDENGMAVPFYALYGHLDYGALRLWLDEKIAIARKAGGPKAPVTVKAGEEIGRIGPWNPNWGYHLHLGIRLTPLPVSGWGLAGRSAVDAPDGATHRLGWEDPWDFIHTRGPVETFTAIRKLATVRVMAGSDWVATGVVGQRGSGVRLRTTGKWSHGREGGDIPYYDADGFNKFDATAILPRCRIGALIGRVGNGPPFRIGTEKLVVFSGDGELFLRMNDGLSAFSNNRGAVVSEFEQL